MSVLFTLVLVAWQPSHNQSMKLAALGLHRLSILTAAIPVTVAVLAVVFTLINKRRLCRAPRDALALAAMTLFYVLVVTGQIPQQYRKHMFSGDVSRLNYSKFRALVSPTFVETEAGEVRVYTRTNVDRFAVENALQEAGLAAME